MVDGKTQVVPHIGFPTDSFKAPMIYNPWFEARGINALVLPFWSEPDAFAPLLKELFRCANIKGALITMPHKVSVTALVDELSVKARIAGSANAVGKTPDGRLVGDMFDGEGFVRGMLRKGQPAKERRALVVGVDGVGSAIAASLAEAGVSEIGLYDPAPGAA